MRWCPTGWWAFVELVLLRPLRLRPVQCSGCSTSTIDVRTPALQDLSVASYTSKRAAVSSYYFRSSLVSINILGHTNILFWFKRFQNSLMKCFDMCFGGTMVLSAGPYLNRLQPFFNSPAPTCWIMLSATNSRCWRMPSLIHSFSDIISSLSSGLVVLSERCWCLILVSSGAWVVGLIILSAVSHFRWLLALWLYYEYSEWPRCSPLYHVVWLFWHGSSVIVSGWPH